MSVRQDTVSDVLINVIKTTFSKFCIAYLSFYSDNQLISGSINSEFSGYLKWRTLGNYSTKDQKCYVWEFYIA